MANIKSRIKGAASPRSYSGRILSLINGRARIALSHNGSILSNVPVIGGGSIGSTATITYINGEPIAYTTGTKTETPSSRYATQSTDTGDVNVSFTLTALDSETDDTSVSGWNITDDGLISENGSITLSPVIPAILIGSATDYMTGTGVFVGYNTVTSTAYKMHIGDPTSQYLAWSGTDLTITGTIKSADFSTGISGWQITAAGDAEFSNATIRGELRTAVFTKAYIQALHGSFIVSKAAAVLDTACTATGTTFSVIVRATGGAPFESGDIIRLKDETKNVWGTVGAASGTGPYTYTVTWAYGSTSGEFAEGLAVIDYGTSGDGFLFMTADDTNGPFYSIVSHTGNPWTSQTLQAKLGNLNGSYGISSNLYGIGLGNYVSGNYLRYDPVGGFTLSVGTAGVTMNQDGIKLSGGSSGIDFYRGITKAGSVMHTYSYTGTVETIGTHIAAGNATQTELLSNTSFDTDTTGWTLDTYVLRTTSYSRTGAACIEMTFFPDTPIQNEISLASEYITATAGYTYEFSIYSKTRYVIGPTFVYAWPQIEFFNSSNVSLGVAIYGANSLMSTTDYWEKAVVVGTAPATTAKLKVSYRISQDTYSGEGYVIHLADDASLITTTSNESLLSIIWKQAEQYAQLSNSLNLKDITAPAAPASGYGRLYVNSDRLYFKDDAGNAVSLGNRLGCRVYNDAAISHATSGTAQALTFNTERWDTGSMHDTSTNTGRLTCTQAGKYLIGGHVEWAANTTGRRVLGIRLNGSTTIAGDAKMPVTDSGVVTTHSISTEYDLAVGDYVELMTNQASGGALNINATGNYSPEFWAYRIGD